MPPKRKAAAAKKAGGKKAKTATEEPEPSTFKDAINKLKAADKGKKVKHSVDKHSHWPNASILEDYNCMLNQTNIGHNNNKFYIIQVIDTGSGFVAWNRWGRVGETGDCKATHGTKEECIKLFEKKFQDKTQNKWANRENFTPKAKKYTLIEMAGEEEEEDTVDAPKVDLSGKKIAESKLDKVTQKFISMIFDLDMFKDSMAKFDIDVKKMPLGKLSKTQIAKGFEVLDEIENVLNKKKKGNLKELASKFYTVIPHNFGRRIPPEINTTEALRQKMDMLMVLADIELAQEMSKEKDKKLEATTKGEVPNPLDVNYEMLKCDLKLLDPKSNEYKLIETYTNQTQGYRKVKLQHVWEMNREGDDDRFSAHKDISHRKLLWHGTNVAVVAAILKTGLRIMPHSGGRVGKGIYFASENGKSAGYVSCNKKTGVMFLSEVALGKQKIIFRDDHTLKAAPKGFDSVLAKGDTEPDTTKDKTITLDGQKVIIPQGKPVNQKNSERSSFSQSEYLIYKESQNRLRYMLQLEFSY